MHNRETVFIALTISLISITTQEILIVFVLSVLNLMRFSWQCKWVVA
jgi:hypothetical protein